jgi:hypothetical protein
MENRQTRNILISCGVILIVACLCLSFLIISGIGVSLIWPFSTDQGSALPTPVQEPTPLEETTNIPTGEAENLPSDLADKLFQIESEVVNIRGLTSNQPVNRTLISTEELEEIVTQDFFADYNEQDARQDVLILSLLGLLPVDFELKSFYESLYSEQIAGFYDDETEEIYVVQGADFGGSEKLTYAHEFTHVLQDQVYDLEEGLGLNEDACEADSEKCAAVQALIEGDASQTEILWFQTYASREDYQDLVQAYDNFESPILDAAPPYMSADLYFPYEKGLSFVQYLYEQGGYAAVDGAYQNLPVSTEQILHPEKYPDDRPISVDLPDFSVALGSGWELVDENEMGEWYIHLILSQAYDETHRISERKSEKAAAGWGGDTYAFYLNEETEEITFVMDAVWDTTDDAEEFAEAFKDYADQRWDESDELILDFNTWSGANLQIVSILEGNRTIWVMGPSAEIVEAVLLELQ